MEKLEGIRSFYFDAKR